MNNRIAAGLLALCLALPAFAQSEAPDAMVQRVADEVLLIVKQDREIKAGNSERAMALVEEKVLPQFDFTRMTALAVGLPWRTASAEQKLKLVAEFQNLLVRTYSSALSRVTDQKLEYKQLKLKPEDTRVVVSSLLKQSGAAPITIDYRMAKLAQGWKVYDVVVDGVSLITTYRGSFAEQVNSSGLDGLVKMLVDKNAELRAKSG